jgi:hypothetical protein
MRWEKTMSERLSDDRVNHYLKGAESREWTIYPSMFTSDLESLCREVMDRREQDALQKAYREVAEAVVFWCDAIDRQSPNGALLVGVRTAAYKHAPAIRAAMEDDDE